MRSLLFLIEINDLSSEIISSGSVLLDERHCSQSSKMFSNLQLSFDKGEVSQWKTNFNLIYQKWPKNVYFQKYLSLVQY